MGGCPNGNASAFQPSIPCLVHNEQLNTALTTWDSHQFADPTRNQTPSDSALLRLSKSLETLRAYARAYIATLTLFVSSYG